MDRGLGIKETPENRKGLLTFEAELQTSSCDWDAGLPDIRDKNQSLKRYPAPKTLPNTKTESLHSKLVL